jgi:hypothetical protein
MFISMHSTRVCTVAYLRVKFGETVSLLRFMFRFLRFDTRLEKSFQANRRLSFAGSTQFQTGKRAGSVSQRHTDKTETGYVESDLLCCFNSV